MPEAPPELKPLLTIPWPFRMLNRIGNPLMDMGIRPGKLDLESCLKKAEKATGLSDLGDSQVLVNLEVLVRAFQDNEAEMTFIGRQQLLSECYRMVSGRLLAEAAFKRSPIPDPGDPDHPLFIVGLPRTGSTALHNLLCQDPNTRVPAFWRLFRPFPLPGESDASRRQSGADLLETMAKNMPITLENHPMELDLPEECLWFFCFEGVSFQLEATFGLQAYRDHLLTLDWTHAVAFHRRLVGYLQHEVPGKRWVLKAPSHLLRVQALGDAYPSAKFIWTHRDPKKVIPSICQLFEAARSVTERTLDRDGIGRSALAFWSQCMSKAMAARQTLGDHRFVDMCFSAFIGDTAETAKGLYRAMDLPVNREMELGLDTWVQNNPKTKKEKPVPITLERYGLEAKAVDRAFGDYIDTYRAFF